MVSVQLTMQTDDSLDLFINELNEVDTEGMLVILERVKRDIIRFLIQRYQDQPQQKGHGLTIETTGYLEKALREWQVLEDADGDARLVWNGGQMSAVQEGQYVSTPWSQIYFINKGRAGWGGDNDDFDDVQGFTAYGEPRNSEGKVDLQKYLNRKGGSSSDVGSGTFVSPRSAEMSHQEGLIADKKRKAGFDPDELGAYRLAIYEWSQTKGLSQYWAAIANKIAKHGSQPSIPSLTEELLGSTFPSGEATMGKLLIDIIGNAVKDYLNQAITPQKGKMGQAIPIANVFINIAGRWQVAQGQTITIGEKVYGGGKFIPKGTYGQTSEGLQIT